MKPTSVLFLMLSVVCQVICASATCTEQTTSTIILFVTDTDVNNSDVGKTTALAMGSSYNGTVSFIPLTGALTNPLVTTLTETAHANSTITVPGSTSTDEMFDLSLNSSDLDTIAFSLISLSTAGFVASDDTSPVSTIVDGTALTPSYISSASVKISTSITMTSFVTSTSTLILTISTNTYSNKVTSFSSYTAPSTALVTTITVSPIPLVVVASNSTIETALVYNLNTTLFGTVYVVPTAVSNSTQTVRVDHPGSSVTAHFTNGTSGNITASLASVVTHPSQGFNHTSGLPTISPVFIAMGSRNKIPTPIIWLVMIFKSVFAGSTKDSTLGPHPPAQSIITGSCLPGWECSTETTWKSTTTITAAPTSLVSTMNSWNQTINPVTIDTSTEHQNELRQIHTTVSIPDIIFPTQDLEGTQSSPCPESSVTDSRPESIVTTNTTIIATDTNTATVTVTNPAKETVTLTYTLHRSFLTSLTQWSNGTATRDTGTVNATAAGTEIITANVTVNTNTTSVGTGISTTTTTTPTTIPPNQNVTTSHNRQTITSINPSNPTSASISTSTSKTKTLNIAILTVMLLFLVSLTI